jgi:hypothetical protein
MKYFDGKVLNWWGEVWEPKGDRYTPLPTDKAAFFAPLNRVIAGGAWVEGDLEYIYQHWPSFSGLSRDEIRDVFWKREELCIPFLSAHHIERELPYVLLDPTPLELGSEGDRKVLQVIYAYGTSNVVAWAIITGGKVEDYWITSHPALRPRNPKVRLLFGDIRRDKVVYRIIEGGELEKLMKEANEINKSLYERSLQQ